MIYQYFSLKIEDGALHFQDANFSVSSQINKSQVSADLVNRLRKLKLATNVKLLDFIVRDNYVYVEGWAYEEVAQSVPELIIAD